MKHLFNYFSFNENINQLKIYKKINNIVDNEKVKYYNIPFNLFEKGICIKNSEKEVLCFSNKFYYDFIKDAEIKKALKLDLSKIDITDDWTDKMKTTFAYENSDIHTLRIAKLVLEIQNNIPITPVLFFFDDRSFIYKIPNYVEDGNHRIRALKFLKYDYFPAYVHGNFTKYLLKYLKNK